MLQKPKFPENLTIGSFLILLLLFAPFHESFSKPAGKTSGDYLENFMPQEKEDKMGIDEKKIPLREDFDWDRVDELFCEWDKPGSPGAAVGVIHKGEFIYRQGYGEANLDHGVPVTPGTVFSIASVSKQFTAACIAIMYEKGLIDLDDDIREYFPEMPEYEEPVLVRHLPHHTSGIRDKFQMLNFAEIPLANVITLDDIVEVVSSQSELNFTPGERHMYSNSGYALMAVLVERVTGKTLREFAHENIFEPLGMDNTHFHDNRNEIVKNRAISYQKRDEEFSVGYRGNYQIVGAAGLNTTIEDMLKWDRNLYENSLEHSPNLNRIMHRRGILNDGDTTDYAFGLRIGDHRGVRTVGHGGSLMGFRTSYLRIPEQEFSVIVFSNLGSFSPGSLASDIADLYLEEFFEEKMEKYKGTYVNRDLDVSCEIKMEEGKLVMDRQVSPRGEMTHTGAGEFSMGSWSIEFYHDENGEVAGFKVDRSRALNVKYEKE